MRLRALLLLPFLLGLCAHIATAQTATTLQTGVPVERKLTIGQVHEFIVNAQENSFVQIVVEQKGIDVVVKIASPDGSALGERDTPNGDQGSERVSFLASAAGKYRISITPLDAEGTTSGQYEIKLVEVREATEEEIATSKNREAAKAKGIALLLDLRDAIAQIKSPSTRINTQLTAANLLREVDEKGAAKYLTDAVAELREMLVSPSDDEDSDEAMEKFSSVSQLRNDVIRILAETDPDAAMSFLHSTAPKYSPYGNSNDLAGQESTLELSIVDQIARKDPNRALQIAKKNLKQAYSPALMTTASQLAEKNPELAAELVHDISSKLMAEDKLISKVEAATLAMAMMAYYSSTDKHVDLALTDDSPNAVQTLKMQQGPRPGLVSEQEYKQLVQKLVREVLAYNTSASAYPNGDALWIVMSQLKSLGPELDKIASGSLAALEKKQTELVGNNQTNQWVNQFQEISTAIANNPVEGAMEAIEKAPAQFKEQLYVMLATKEATNGDLTRAKQILNEHVSNPFQRNQALRSIEQTELDRAMSSGKIEEALKNIAALKTPADRAEQLVQLAPQIGSDQKRATALSLLEQARALLPASPQAEDQTQMNALLEIARAYSPYDSKRSFEIVDPLIEQFNDLCNAAHTLEGFGFQNFDYDELDMRNEGPLAVITDQMAEVMGSLALINFDRAKTTTDKLRLPEVRLHVYMRIAEQTIKGKQ
jgi:hypothetical protein